jgi:hypothetical protein
MPDQRLSDVSDNPADDPDDVAAAGPAAVTRRTPPAAPLAPADALALDEARGAIFDAVAAWLTVTWEVPILRSMSSNAGRGLDNAANFPALRAALRGLQAGARDTAVAALTPLLDAEAPLRDQALVSSVDGILLQLVGLIGEPIRDAGFDPLNGGLDRIQDGFRLKAMTEHGDITAAVQAYSTLTASLMAERAARLEQEREDARIEVERLWHATADLP